MTHPVQPRRRPRGLAKALTPLALLAGGLWLHAGCFYVPGGKVEPGQTDFRQYLGNEKSNKPLRPHTTMQDQVRALLGPPWGEYFWGQVWVYGLREETGYWVYPLCFTTQPTQGVEFVRLDFLPDGRLSHFESRRMDGDGGHFFGGHVQATTFKPWPDLPEINVMPAPVGPTPASPPIGYPAGGSGPAYPANRAAPPPSNVPAGPQYETPGSSR